MENKTEFKVGDTVEVIDLSGYYVTPETGKIVGDTGKIIDSGITSAWYSVKLSQLKYPYTHLTFYPNELKLVKPTILTRIKNFFSRNK